MQRVLSTATLLGLLVASAAAFAITEHLKLIKSPIFATRVTKLFSPVCGCGSSKATISVRLRQPDRLTVTIENAARQRVATLATDVREPKGRVTFQWDGRTDGGVLVTRGTFRPEVRLASSRRTILLPNPIVVDTTRPKVLAATVAHPSFTPAGKHKIAIHYVLSEQAHALVYLNGREIIRGRPSRTHAALKWGGKVNGKPLRPGLYVLSVGAVDAAGNATPASAWQHVTVLLQAISVGETHVLVRPRARFTVDVRTIAAAYEWRFAGRHGRSHQETLRLRAPAKRGRYRLVVSEHGHTANVLVRVSGR